MPAEAPRIGDLLAVRLVALGARIRAHREAQKVTAASAAEAAGLSRVTLHRIERGEPSVTMGAYLSVIDALGLELDLAGRRAQPAGVLNAVVPTPIRLDDYPQLKRLAWQRHRTGRITPAEALNLYERNWRHVDAVRMDPAERALVDALVATIAAWRACCRRWTPTCWRPKNASSAATRRSHCATASTGCRSTSTS